MKLTEKELSCSISWICRKHARHTYNHKALPLLTISVEPWHFKVPLTNKDPWITKHLSAACFNICLWNISNMVFRLWWDTSVLCVKGVREDTQCFLFPLILLCLLHCPLWNSVFCHNLNLSNSLPIYYHLLTHNLSLHSLSFIPHSCLPSFRSVSLSLSRSFSFNLSSTLMDFTAGGHSGLLLKSSVSEMRVIFLLKWIICIYLPPLGTDACLN